VEFGLDASLFINFGREVEVENNNAFMKGWEGFTRNMFLGAMWGRIRRWQEGYGWEKKMWSVMR